MRTTTHQRISMFNKRAAMTDEQIRQRAPSVFAGHAMEGVSDRYSFLPTINAVRALRDAGWTPVNCEEQRVRLEGRQGFQRHMVRFWRTDRVTADGPKVVGEFVPEVSLINSHDRSSAWVLPVGVYRFTCSNGMMVSDGTFEPMRVRHSGCAIDEIVKASLLTLEQLPKVGAEVGRMQARQMTDEDKRGFAEKALVLRFDDPNTAPIHPSILLRPSRYGDDGDSLWSVFNRVQENLTMGGQRDHSRRDADGFSYPKTRAVLGLSQNVRLNQELWTVAKSFLN